MVFGPVSCTVLVRPELNLAVRSPELTSVVQQLAVWSLNEEVSVLERRFKIGLIKEKELSWIGGGL